MQKSLNRVTLIGNVGFKSNIFHMNNGIDVINLSIATSESWKNKETGNYDTRTTWHKIVVYGKTAKYVETYINCGAQVFVEGSLRNKTWTDKEGIEKNTCEIVVNFNDKIMALGNKHSTNINDINTNQDEKKSFENEDFDFDFNDTELDA